MLALFAVIAAGANAAPKKEAKKVDNSPVFTVIKKNPITSIKSLKRVSSPGLRQYTGYKDMPRVINGLGIAIISTSKGVMTNKEAAAEKIGGEVLCYIY